MVRKIRSQLRDSRSDLGESVLAAHIGKALRDELGGSRRATKTVMRWTDVSDTTARAWLNGQVCPSGFHLISLAANSRGVMFVMLRLTGYSDLEVGLNLREIESGLLKALAQIRAVRSENQPIN